ncbi:uncharacterized protein LOC109615357 isoform X2 [Esox lucius]|uniref:uncharacterized protein LOC109615357 isoform X2 n=1 Tax=Esox lucius TaxID=8010 RepID=UPI001476BB81|nr:uncharacterized protein LOC109615357 isoform X2 [Esox lucius]
MSTSSKSSLSSKMKKSPIQRKRPASPGPSCVSMKSDNSMDLPLNLREGDFSTEQRDRPEISLSEILSGQPVQCPQKDLSSIFSVLEQNIITFVKKELKRFKTMLSSDLPEGFKSQREDDKGVDPEDKKQERSAKEGTLKITLHFLRHMKQKELADTLEKSTGHLKAIQR